jgi:hypothetical protein
MPRTIDKTSLSAFVVTAAAALFLASSSANAVPVTWTLEDVVFSDGGTATGSYVYNASTNTLSNIHIVTSANAPFGTTYGVPTPGATLSTLFDTLPSSSNLADLTGSPRLIFELLAAMTDAGGTISLDTSYAFEAICAVAVCGGAPAADRMITSGEVTTTPLPAALPLFAAGLGALGLLRGRRKKKAAAHAA